MEMTLRALEALAGVILTALALLDVFDTVVAPGASSSLLQVAARTHRLTLPYWRRRAAAAHGPNRLSRALAPSIFIVTFVVWMSLLVLGFGLIADGLRSAYAPPIRSFPDALFTAGSSIVTIGESGRDAEGLARWGVLVSGFSGLAVVTLAITYILAVQGGLRDRDATIAQLNTTAGRPPSGIALLETYAALGGGSDLGDLFRTWRSWASTTLFSHSAFPVLAFFRSVASELDWPLAVGVVLDAAALYAAFVDGEHAGAATLLHRDGSRLTAGLGDLFRIPEHEPEPIADADLVALTERLAAAGFRVRAGADARSRFVSLRSDYHGRLASLAAHFGVDGLTLER